MSRSSALKNRCAGWLTFIAQARTPERQILAYAKLRALLEDFSRRSVLDFDEQAAEEFRRLKGAEGPDRDDGPEDRGHRAVRAKLISRNLGDFRKVPGLDVEDWTAG